MSNNMKTFNAHELARRLIGATRILDSLDFPQQSYPLYNVLCTGDRNTFIIEVAVAGFTRDQLSVVKDGTNIVVSGDMETTKTSDFEFVHQGISRKKFTKNFPVTDNLVVKGVKLENGILAIHLQAVIPESEKPTQFAID